MMSRTKSFHLRLTSTKVLIGATLYSTKSRFANSFVIARSRSESPAVLGSRSYCVCVRGHHHDRVRHWPLFLHAPQVSWRCLLRFTMSPRRDTEFFSQLENRGGGLWFWARGGARNDVFRPSQGIHHRVLDRPEIPAAFIRKLSEYNIWLELLIVSSILPFAPVIISWFSFPLRCQYSILVIVYIHYLFLPRDIVTLPTKCLWYRRYYMVDIPYVVFAFICF